MICHPFERGRWPSGGSGKNGQAIDVTDGEYLRRIEQRHAFLIRDVAAALTGRAARLWWNLNSGSRVGEISANVDVLTEGIGRAERQAVRQSFFNAGLGGVVVVDAVALHQINRAVALIGTARIERRLRGWNARHDYGPVVGSLGQ